MESLGYDETVVDPFGTVIGRVGEGPTTIVYDAHVDTVGVGSLNEWSSNPYEPRISGGVMYGRGAACDDRGGIAAMVMGGALYKELCPIGDVTLYVVGETPSLNAVPSTSTIYADHRVTIGEDPEAALAEIRDLPAVKAAGAEVELLTDDGTSFTGLTLGMAKQYPTWVLPKNDKAVQAGIAAGKTALGRSLSTGHWVFSTNGVASMGKLGILTVGDGPGNEIHAHTVADQCPIDDLVDSMAWYPAFPTTYVSAVSAQPKAETT
jgi:acetylornithine deacetylase/succinyl-diaminopimelate desuccinylase-like protein